jgi:fructose-bisphosphate aldolase class II
MIDASSQTLEENIRITKEVVEYAHSKGVVVEAELGKLAGVEDEVNVSAEDATYTNAKEAKEFVERTGIDSLAVAIGTSHGANKFKGEPKLAYNRLKEIMDLLPEGYPLVLHGSSSVYPESVAVCNEFGGNLKNTSGVPDDMLSKACTKYNVCKINVDTDLRIALTGGIRKSFVEDPTNFDPRKYLGPAREAVRATVSHKIKNVFKSSNSCK